MKQVLIKSFPLTGQAIDANHTPAFHPQRLLFNRVNKRVATVELTADVVAFEIESTWILLRIASVYASWFGLAGRNTQHKLIDLIELLPLHQIDLPHDETKEKKID